MSKKFLVLTKKVPVSDDGPALVSVLCGMIALSQKNGRHFADIFLYENCILSLNFSGICSQESN